MDAAGIIEKAKALVVLRSALGPLFAQQLDALVHEALALGITQGAAVLAQLSHLGLLDAAALAHATQLLFASPATSTSTSISIAPSPTATATPTATASATATATSTSAASGFEWDGVAVTGQTDVAQLREPLVRRLASDTSVAAFDSFVASLRTFGIESVDALLQAEESERQYKTLSDFMASEHSALLFDVAAVLRSELPFVAARERRLHEERLRHEQAAREAVTADVAASTSTSSSLTTTTAASSLSTSSTMTCHQLWSADAQALFVVSSGLPDVHVFCSIDPNSGEQEQAPGQAGVGGGAHGAAAKTDEHVLFYLDISASMNHDDKGVYVAPGSPDHPASSIKKARALIPTLVVPTLRRGGSATVVVWSYKLRHVIGFSAAMFTDAESGELHDERAIAAAVSRMTDESVFCAKGGTNIDAALSDVCERVRTLSASCAAVGVWFLTDGEETVYNRRDGEPEHIPSAPNDPLLAHFTVPDAHGLTGHQRELVDRVRTCMFDVADQRCTIDFHVCHFGEAHPLFLRAVREAAGGHFHAIADLSRIADEMTAASTQSADRELIFESLADGASTSSSSLSSSSSSSLLTARVPATVTSAAGGGFIQARGTVPALFLRQAVVAHRAVRIRCSWLRERATTTLESYECSTLPDELQSAVAQVLELEPRLGAIIGSLESGGDINGYKLSLASRDLRDLRVSRNDAIAAMARKVHAHTLLGQFLEKVLETTEVQIATLERLLDQYHQPEGTNYDKLAAKRTELFSTREQQAIAAGLDSMKVRLGNGFVSQACLDHRIQRIVAEQGPWARKMLNRVCLLARSDDAATDTTRLTLLIVEGHIYRAARRALLRRDPAVADYLAKNPTANWSIHETLTHAPIEAHDNEHYQAMSNIVITLKPSAQDGSNNNGGAASEQVYRLQLPTKSVYLNTVASYSCSVSTAALDEADVRMRDPLSFSGLLDLISESNTLPARLYTVAASQSIGLLYNSKEMVHVMSGGADITSFEYFRLYYRLAEKTGANNEIRIPGLFHAANVALPVAPEPLTNLVLSNLMPGLLSEFVTGTVMAPLSGSGNLYIGFLMMHMRARRLSGVDVSRIAEILATLACWIDNPYTAPKPDEFRDMIDRLVASGRVPTADSPGKHVPIKAVAYTLLDDLHAPPRKLDTLQAESVHRYFKFLLPVASAINSATPDKSLTPQIIAQQVPIRSFVLELVRKLAGPDEVDRMENGVPVGLLAAGRRFAALIRGANTGAANVPAAAAASSTSSSAASSTTVTPELLASDDEILEFLAEPRHLQVVADTLYEILVHRAALAFAEYLHWSQTQRLFFVWFAIARNSISDLKRTFAAFETPTAFENSVVRTLATLYDGAFAEVGFANTLLAWLAPADDSDELEHVSLEYERQSGSLRVRRLQRNSEVPLADVSERDRREALLRLWRYFAAAVRVYHWKGRPSNLFGLLEVDYDVVAALQDHDNRLGLLDRLSQVQVAEYHAARDHRNAAYARYVPAKQQVAGLSDYYVSRQPLRHFTTKTRISLVVIGNVDSGKSTTSGHLIYRCGYIDKHEVERYARAARLSGRESAKFAWIMDQLRDERERGLTISTSSWSLATERFEIDLLDAPGHRSFIKNMAVGASMADVAILIVSAAAGEFEAGIARGGMTREEALVAYAAGIRRFIVIVNKMDAVDFALDRYNEVSAAVLDCLKKIGITPATVPVIPMSAWTGDNMVARSENMPWWNGWLPAAATSTSTSTSSSTSSSDQAAPDATPIYTLLEAIDSITPPPRAPDLPLRVPIFQSVQVHGVGTVAIGRIVQGTLKRGESVILSPGDLQCEVTSIEQYHVDRSVAMPGDIIGFRVKGATLASLHRGMVACPRTQPVPAVLSFTAQVIVLSHPGTLRVGYTPFFMCHTASFPARFVKLLQKIDRRSGAVLEENPTEVRRGDCVTVQLQVLNNRPVCLERHVDCAALGRFVIRDSSFTVGVGVVRSIDETAGMALKAKKTSSRPVKSKYFRS